jgi:serine/threonine protein kinase
MIRRREHGFSLDWYLLGVLLYELLVGMPPFYSTVKEKLFDNILQAKLIMPPGITPDCEDLIRKLMDRNPQKRLGHARDADEVKLHPWFKKINWDDVYHKKLIPPASADRPITKNPTIAQKFAKVKSEEPNNFPNWSFKS